MPGLQMPLLAGEPDKCTHSERSFERAHCWISANQPCTLDLTDSMQMERLPWENLVSLFCTFRHSLVTYAPCPVAAGVEYPAAAGF